MKSNMLACFFIALLCCKTLSSLALGNVSPSENTVELDQQFHDGREEVKEERVYSMTGQKGKGPYGDSNINHKPSRSGSREISESSISISLSSAAISLSFYVLRPFFFIFDF